MKPIGLLALLAASIGAISQGGQLLAQTGARPDPSWAYLRSDVPADSAIRFGTLPNGMRYALRRNANPPGQIALRLRIGAGSLVERDDQQGLAHFLEHLTFRGTTNLPGNALIERLQREGTRVRATTGFNETMYDLDLPRGEASLDTGLLVLREMASKATLAADVIDQERGVVQGEQRFKDDANYRREVARLRFLVPRLSARMTIGDMEVIRTASRARIVEFYNAYYRPSHATLVAVGDFDVDQMETQIRRRFADWTPAGPAGPDADRREADRRAPQAKINVDATADPSLDLIWLRPPDRAPDSRAKRRTALLRILGIAVLSERVAGVGRSGSAPFERARANNDSIWGAAQATIVSATIKPGLFDAALSALAQTPHQLVRYGITDEELHRQVAERRMRLQTAAAEGAAQSSAGYAAGIVRAIGTETVPTTAQAELALFDEAVKGLTPTEVTRALQPLFTDAGPFAILSTPAPIPGGAAAVLARLEAARRSPVSPPVRQAELAWPYTNFGRPGTVASRREIAGMGATVVTFANGTVLTVKPTTLEPGEILVTVRAGLGRLATAADRSDPLFGAGAYLTEGGLGKLTAEQLDYLLTGRVVSYIGSVRSDRFEWFGRTRPEDLALQTQLLAAFVTDPGLRPEPLERFKARYVAPDGQGAPTPGDALQRHLRALTTPGGRSAASPSREEVQSLNMAVAGPRLRQAIGQGPIRVVMVGDLTVDQAIAATASTFGALPPRPVAPVSQAETRLVWPLTGGGEVVQLRHAGDAAQALAFVSWPGPDRIDHAREYLHAELLAGILGFRVTQTIRDRLGLAYVPSAGLGVLGEDRRAGRFFASAETTPANTATFHAAMDGIARDLQSIPVTADELNRARVAPIQRSRTERASNRYWLGVLEGADAGSGPVAELQAQAADYEAVTPADLQALARKYLRPESAWRASVTPASPAQASPAAPKRD